MSPKKKSQKPPRCFVCFESKDHKKVHGNSKVPLKIPERILKYMSDKLSTDILKSLKSLNSSFENFYCSKCIQFSTDLSRLFVQLDETESKINASILLYVERITNCRKLNGASEETSIKISENIFCDNNDTDDDVPSPVNYPFENDDLNHDSNENQDAVSNDAVTIIKEPSQNLPQKRLPRILKKAVLKKEAISSLKIVDTRTVASKAVRKPRKHKKQWLFSTYGLNALKLTVSLERVVPQQCNTCKKVFVSRTALEAHKSATSHDNSNFDSCELHPILKCPTCKIHLHIMKTYQKLKPGQCSVRCSICKKSFIAAKVVNKQKQKSVIAKVHKKGSEFPNIVSNKHKVYRFKCDMCSKVFWSEAGLLTHVTRHENDKSEKRESENAKENVTDENPIGIPKNGKPKVNTAAEKYECKKCSRQFVDNNLLIAHEKYSKCNMIQCKLCSTSHSPALIKSHMKHYHPEEVVIDDDEEDEDVIIEPENHTKVVESKKKTDTPNPVVTSSKHTTDNPMNLLKSSLKCMICKNSLQRYESFPKNLMKIETPGKAAFYCSHCKKAFILATNSRALGTYYYNRAIESARKFTEAKYKPTAEQNKYKCPDCTGVFATHYIFLVHKQWDCVKIKRTCDLCTQEFKSADQLKMHVAEQHFELPKSNWNICSDCDESYSEEAAHQSICSKTSNKQCEKCDCVTSNEILLIKHLEMKHGHTTQTRVYGLKISSVDDDDGKRSDRDGEKRLCEQCGKIFKNIKSHYSRCARNVKRQAEQQKKIEERRKLKRIEKKKKAKKAVVKMRYICNFCPGEGKKLVNFKGKKELRKHVNDVHIFVHKCETCGKGFRTPSGIKIHAQQVHTTSNG